MDTEEYKFFKLGVNYERYTAKIFYKNFRDDDEELSEMEKKLEELSIL